MNANPYEPTGFTDGDRYLAPSSPFHEDGPRKLVPVALLLTVSVPANYTAASAAHQLEFSVLSDPYVRDARRIPVPSRRASRRRKRRHARSSSGQRA
jgi:hypothetical protein